MILDKQTLFSDAQVITADEVSDNIYDTGATPDVGPGMIHRILATVPEAFDNLTSMTISLQTDDNSSFSSATTLWSVSRTLAQLAINSDLKLPPVPRGCERYLRLNYDVVGTNPSVGKITAGIILNEQANVPTRGNTGFN